MSLQNLLETAYALGHRVVRGRRIEWNTGYCRSGILGYFRMRFTTKAEEAIAPYDAGWKEVSLLLTVNFVLTEQESPNDQLTVREQSAEKPSKQDQLNEYVEMLGIGAFGEISDGMGVALGAFESGDVDTVLSVAGDIEEKCNRIIDMENIPEIAERSHEYAVSAASAYKEAAVSLAMAAKMLDEGKVSDATEYVSSVTENLEEARDEIDHMTSAVNDMKRQAAE